MATEELNGVNEMGVESGSPSHSRSSNAAFHSSDHPRAPFKIPAAAAEYLRLEIVAVLRQHLKAAISLNRREETNAAVMLVAQIASATAGIHAGAPVNIITAPVKAGNRRRADLQRKIRQSRPPTAHCRV
nr:hypothetical protein Iba_chr14fCG10030 [Ipomoea batatas]